MIIFDRYIDFEEIILQTMKGLCMLGIILILYIISKVVIKGILHNPIKLVLIFLGIIGVLIISYFIGYLTKKYLGWD